MSQSNQTVVEWMTVRPGCCVYVYDDGRFSIRRDWISFDASSSTGYGDAGAVDPRVAKGLLASAIWCAREDAARTESPPATTPGLLGYVWNLCGSYVTTHATPQTMRRFAARLRQAGRPGLADYAEEKAREETGHDRLALRDLAALGLPAETVVAAIRPRGPVALVDYFTTQADGVAPIGCFGYAYALERSVMAIGQEAIDNTQALCPPGVHATRCMRVHSAVGSDAGHVDEMVAMVAGLPVADRVAIARATYQTMMIMCARHDDDDIGDDEIRRRLEAIAGPLPAHLQDAPAAA